jgi:ANTAR domain
MSGTAASGETVVRKSERGWVVGGQEASDLTSAMVLADLLAADLALPAPASPAPVARGPALIEASEAARLAVTVSQLEHALTARVRVEQAIGVLAERHRLRSRDAFDLLRSAARSRGRRVLDIAEDVVNSTTNSLLRLPEELERSPEPRARIRSARRSRPAG